MDSETPIQYLTEDELINPVRTDIGVGYLRLFRTFLDANDMTSFEVGYYAKPDPYWNSASSNYICYTNNNSNFLIESNLMHMKLKYGGLIPAFKDFQQLIGKR